uniref:Endosulfine alpha n=1 Tax=Cyanistes caeruleus TaxID=156563 RepID=A0A8C0UIM9_CYACU
MAAPLGTGAFTEETGQEKQDTQEKDKAIPPERAEEAKLKAKYPNLGQKPGGSDFLMKRLQKGEWNSVPLQEPSEIGPAGSLPCRGCCRKYKSLPGWWQAVAVSPPQGHSHCPCHPWAGFALSWPLPVLGCSQLSLGCCGREQGCAGAVPGLGWGCGQ